MCDGIALIIAQLPAPVHPFRTSIRRNAWLPDFSRNA